MVEFSVMPVMVPGRVSGRRSDTPKVDKIVVFSRTW